MPSSNIRVQEFDVEEERRIAIGIITSTNFLAEIKRIFKKGYFKVTYLDMLAGMCFNFYDQYQQAPGREIEDVFLRQKLRIRNPKVIENIEAFFEVLDNYYLESEEDFNTTYFLDRAKEYFEKRVLEKTARNLLELVNNNKVEEAKKLLKNSQFTADNLDLEVRLKSINQDYLQETLGSMENFDSGEVFQLESRGVEGRLTELMGPFFGGDLIAYLGPFKTGKSFFLEETAFQAAESRKRTIFISLEMAAKKVDERIFSRLTGMSNIAQRTTYPAFDCLKNQLGECTLDYYQGNGEQILDRRPIKKRREKTGINELITNFNKFVYDPEYIVCDYCRSYDNLLTTNYELAFYRRYINLEQLNPSRVIEKGGVFGQYFGEDLFFYYIFPSFSAHLTEVANLIQKFENTYEEPPAVIAIDYADLLVRKGNEQYRSELNEIWQFLKRLAQEKNIVIATATQTTRKGSEKVTLNAQDLAEDIRKAATVDALYGIQATDLEKDLGILRMNCLLHRHKPYTPSKFLACTQLNAISQPLLDAEWIR